MREFAVFILPVRVHHGQRVRQGFAAKVVIKYDLIYALGRSNRFMRQGAAIVYHQFGWVRPAPLHTSW